MFSVFKISWNIRTYIKSPGSMLLLQYTGATPSLVGAIQWKIGYPDNTDENVYK